MQIIGNETGVNLCDLSPLLAPPLKRDALRLSAELAGATYTLAFEDWLSAGWQDMSVQVDELLMGGIQEAGEGSLVRVTGAAKLELLRARVREKAFGQALGALRQVRMSDTVKAVVMIHPAPEGRYLVAVSFMGTTERLSDWLSNFRMMSEQGWHQGFLQLTEQFELRDRLISFPETARALGLRRLTLRDVLDECRGGESRFRLWLSGHSQGAAVMQVWTARRLAEGLNPRFLTGVGFASPSVCRFGAAGDSRAYPLLHIFNSDDVVPHMGSQAHLGTCLTYPADEALRRACYTWPRDENSVRGRLCARPILRRMTDTGRCIEVGIALLRALRESADPGRFASARLLNPDWPVYRLIQEAGEGALTSALNAIIRRGAAACRSITGLPPDEGRMAEDSRVIGEVFGRIGPEAALKALTEMGINAHTMLRPREGWMGVYPYIANADWIA